MNSTVQAVNVDDTAPFSSDDVKFMRRALALAAEAAAAGEVPIGAVAVKNGVEVAAARNRVEEKHSTAAHAECELLHALEVLTGDWRMSDFTIYVTKEPCPMCAGMLVNSRVGRLVYGVSDSGFGGCGGAVNVAELPGSLWHMPTSGGVLAAESRVLIQNFFRLRRSSR